MHELSIASNIVELVAQAAAGRRVRRVTLEMGQLSGVSPDALAFCFPEVASGHGRRGCERRNSRNRRSGALRRMRGSIRHAEPADDLLLRLVELSAGERR